MGMKKEERAVILLIVVTFIFFTNTVSAADPSWTVSQPVNTSSGQEDQLYTYNFTSNISNPDPDPVSFSFYTLGEDNPIVSNVHGTDKNVSFFHWISLNSSTGILTINATRNNETAVYNITMDLSIPGPQSFGTRLFVFNITTVNDAPLFIGLENKSFNATEVFNYTFNVTDEENDIPFNLTITFMNCSVASWSTRNCDTAGSDGRDLFNISHYSFNTTSGVWNLSFTPLRNDVGSYIINFTVRDLNNSITPYNATRTQIVNFTVANINVAPYFRYVCDNERNTTENALFNCRINVTDIDEDRNITFTTNYTWFTFNTTGTNWTQIAVNSAASYNGSAVVNFTPADAQVGNWSVNVTITDTGSPTKTNSTIFWFFIDNVNDSVTLDYINNLTAYTSNNYTIYVNATDDDLLISDERVYNETLTFTSNNTNASISSSTYIANTNKTQATIFINPSLLGTGAHLVNITVRDANNFSAAERIFNITVLTNNAPVWISPLQTNITGTEDIQLYLNLSQNVSDTDPLNFTNGSSSMESFFINITTGEVNFTPTDRDVGSFFINITVTDGITPVTQQFNFTIANVNDAPNISSLTATGEDQESLFNINISEDASVTITAVVTDDDLLISNTLNNSLNWSIQGPNTTLLTFSHLLFTGATQWFISNTFVPGKPDLGYYNITLNATDSAGIKDTHTFVLIISEVQHAPVMTEIRNRNSSILETFYFDVNTTDEEDGNEQFPLVNSTNLTYTLTNFTSLTGLLLNSYPINRTTGIINFTFNQTFAGILQFNLTVNDSTGRVDTEFFNISVYDYPVFLSPASTFQFNLKESNVSALNFTANHTVGNTLNYTLYINGVVRNSTYGNGNGTAFLWNFTPTLSDETTCSGAVNLTLNISNPKLSNSTTWNVTINHSNSALASIDTINDQSGGSPIQITLSNHFSDGDASDSCTKQIVGFAATKHSGDSITVTITNWTDAGTPLISFSSSSTASANYSLTAYEYTNDSYSSTILSNLTSNNFTVDLITPTTTPTPSGGGGSSKKKPISLKIIVPEPVSAKKKDKLIIPIGVWNDGEIDLNDIILDGIVAKDGLLRTDLIASLDRSFIKSLPAGAKENVTLIVDIDTTATGIFEVTINGTVRNPEYNDWGKFYIEIKEEEDILERLVFTEEFIVGNPECTELKETIDQARELYIGGDLEGAVRKANEALEACREAIAQPPSSRVFERIRGQVVNYISFASLAAFVLGLFYYFYQRSKLKRALRGY